MHVRGRRSDRPDWAVRLGFKPAAFRGFRRPDLHRDRSPQVELCFRYQWVIDQCEGG